MPYKRNAKGFKRVVLFKKAGAACALKRHYRGVFQQVIGYLDLLAANDSERFVFPTVLDIVWHCTKKFKGKEKYKQRRVEEALKVFRADGVISRPLERERNGEMKRGFIVAPHEALAISGKKSCTFVGWGRVPGTYWRAERGRYGPAFFWSPEGPAREAVSNAVERAATALPQVNHGSTTAQPPFTPESAVRSAGTSAVRSAVSDERQCGIQCGTQCGISAPQSSEKQNLNESADGPNLLAFGQSLTERTDETDLTAADQGQNQNPDSDSSSSLVKTDQNQDQKPRMITIREHMGEETTFAQISDDEISKEKIDKYSTKFSYWNELLACCKQVVNDCARLPYLGRKTNGDLMAKAMVQFTEKYRGKKTPTFWYAVAKKLRAAGGPALLAPAGESAEEKEARWQQEMEARVPVPSPKYPLLKFFQAEAERAGIDISEYIELLATATGPWDYQLSAYDWLLDTFNAGNLSDGLKPLAEYMYKHRNRYGGFVPWDPVPWKKPGTETG